jgi:hypothetical protein
VLCIEPFDRRKVQDRIALAGTQSGESFTQAFGDAIRLYLQKNRVR